MRTQYRLEYQLTFPTAPLHRAGEGPQLAGGDGDDTEGLVETNVLLVTIGKIP